MKKSLLVFDIEGFVAHFRKYYSTTTSLSYMFPPRNTIIGLIAAILGLDRDSYYSRFSPHKCDVGVSLTTKARKIVEKINYLNTDAVNLINLRGLNLREPRVQVATEFLVAAPPSQKVGYRAFFHHDDDAVMTELGNRLKDGRFAYPPSLGPANCLANARLVAYDENAEIIEVNDVHVQQEKFGISTVIPQQEAIKIEWSEGLKIGVEERLPPNLGEARKPTGSGGGNYLYEAEGKPIPVRILRKTSGNLKIFKCHIAGKEVYGFFMP